MNTEPSPSMSTETQAQRIGAVVNSALWAAAGDALGWMTELSRGQSGVKYRTGTTVIKEPVDWQRTIGGRSGPRVDLPAGTYSDDTQLRLAVSRSIRGDGSFDVETFAKIEMTVWPTYALGGGLGTKAAASNLARRSVNWFSNFFDNASQKYVSGGGNGAAMRVQPHVWSSLLATDDMILNVLRNALVTHGHPQGFCGAVFHALCLNHALRFRSVPTPENWRYIVSQFDKIIPLIGLDAQLVAFWQSAWEKDGGAPIASAITKMRDEALIDLEIVTEKIRTRTPETYHVLLKEIGCLTPRFRGAGFKTALAAAALAYLYEKDQPESALILASNELDSDTDTIASMAGALLGAAAKAPPKWPLQDREYIVAEATRLAEISLGHTRDHFSYPDLGSWNPPAKQTASVGLFDGELAIAGLGQLVPLNKEYRAGDAIWQWCSLPFGQSILAKRSADLLDKISHMQLPGPRQNVTAARAVHYAKDNVQRSLFSPASPPSNKEPALTNEPAGQTGYAPEGLNGWTDAVIQSEFDDLTLGRLLNQCIDTSQSVELPIAFAAIVAKAKLARKRRRH